MGQASLRLALVPLIAVLSLLGPRGTLTWIGIVSCAWGQQSSSDRGRKLPEAMELANRLQPIPPRSPEEERRSFQVLEGLVVELVAAEPQVRDPVDLTFDAEGRLWVVEMTDYPFGSPSPKSGGQVRLLQDQDGDGYYETATVFLDGLHWPTSVHPWRDGVLVVSPPVLLYGEDRDRDGRADTKQVWIEGFGTQNVQALANNLIWSPEGCFYLANGGNGGTLEVRFPAKPPARLRLGSYDLRLHPTLGVETVTGGGQFGLCVDDYGRRFFCNNSDHARFVVLEERFLARNPYLRVARLVDSIALEGPSAEVFRISPPEPWRVLRTELRAAGLVPGPVEHGGKAVGYFTSATGITIYRGQAMGPPYYGDLFVADVAGNLVHRKKLRPQGATFVAYRTEEKREFLASSDIWFRPVNLKNGPDGALYICDMYREVVEHPASIPDFMKAYLDLARGKDRGRLWRVRDPDHPKSAKPALRGAEPWELMVYLGSSDSWWRETAQRLLLERGNPAVVDPLRTMAREALLPASRVVALRTLKALGGLDEQTLQEALRDPEPGVREQALQLAADRLAQPTVAAMVLQAASDPSPRVRLHAAYLLGELRTPGAVEELARLFRRDASDPWLVAAALSSCNPTWTIRGSNQSVPAAVLERLLDADSSDQQQGRAVTWGPAVRTLAELLAAGQQDQDVARLLEKAARDAALGDLAFEVALGVAQGASQQSTTVESFLRGTDSASWAHWQQILERGFQALRDPSRPPASSELLLSLLAYAPAELFSELVRWLAGPQGNPAWLDEVVRQASRVRKDDWYKPLLSSWDQLTPQVHQTLLQAFLARTRGVEALLAALKEGQLKPTDLSPSVRTQLLAHTDPELRQAAEKLLGPPPSSSRQALVERYLAQGASRRGDARRGQLLFEEHCRTCHPAPSDALLLGPPQDALRSLGPEAIVTAILDPNREVQPQYVSYTAILNDGRVLNGRIVFESATALTFGLPDGTVETVLRSSVETLKANGQSLMPEGFEAVLTAKDVADVVAYLASNPQ